MKIKMYFSGVVILLTVGFLFWSVSCNGQSKIGQGKIRDLLRRIDKRPAGPKVDYNQVNIIGETSKMGGFDPSIEYDSSGNIGWLVYTAIEFPNMSTHLAKTTDHGKTWQYAARINSSIPDKVVIEGKTFEGLWRNEVPTLVHDNNDPGREWKLFSHKYFIKAPYGNYSNTGKPYSHMYIAYKYASSPEKLASAEEIVLFGAGLHPVAPKKARYDLNKLHPDLSSSIVYSEPGSLYKDGVLYLSLSAVGKNGRTFLLSSADHGKTWKYAGTLTDYKDADSLGCTILTATSLVQEKDRLFLLIAPVFKKGKGGVHQGTYIFEFEDISKAKLKRDGRGKLIVYKFLPPGTGEHAGESDYDENNFNGGIIMPRMDYSQVKRGVDPKTVKIFKIFNTNQKIIID